MTKNVLACVAVVAIMLTAGCTISAETDPAQTDAEPLKTGEVKPAPGRPTFEPLRDPKIPDDEMEFHFLEGDATDGLIWQWWMLPKKQCWTSDAIEVDCSLLSTSDRETTFELLADELRLVLTPAGKEPIVKTVKAPFGQYDSAKGLGKTPVKIKAGGEIFELNRLDVRRYFGNIGAGKYSFEMVLPGSSYRILGRDGPRRDVCSPTRYFELFETRLSQALAASSPKATGIRFDILKVDADETVSARVTNRLRIPIVIQIWGNGDGAILDGADAFVDTWRPRGEWRRSITAGWQFCGFGITSRRIAPDESVTLKFMYHLSDGIYRYCYTGWLDDEVGTRWVVRSDPFLINRFHQQKTAAAKWLFGFD